MIKLKYILTLVLLTASKLSIGQNNFPTTGNVGISTGSSLIENKLQIGSNPEGWSGNDVVISGDGSRAAIALASNANEFYLYGSRDISIRPGYGKFALYAKGSNGYVGIGTTDPKYPLTVKGMMNAEADGDYYGAWFGGESRTDKPSVNVGVWWSNKGSMYWNSNRMFFRTQISNTESFENNLVLWMGKVGIGTPDPDELLTVKGKIHTQEIRVDLLGAVAPDYVFEPTYDLRTLEEVEIYICDNRHLPEIPSAKEMEANGVNLKEMNMLLLKKIEELTLYMIEQKKANQELQRQMNELKSIVQSGKN